MFAVFYYISVSDQVGILRDTAVMCCPLNTLLRSFKYLNFFFLQAETLFILLKEDTGENEPVTEVKIEPELLA